MSKEPRGQPSIPCDSGQGPMVCGVDQLSQSSRALFRGPAGSTSSTARLVPGCDSQWFQQALPGDSGQCPRARDEKTAVLGDSRSGPRLRCVDKLSRLTRERVCGPAVSTSCRGLLGPGSEGPKCRPDVPGDSRPCPRVHSVDQLCWATQGLCPEVLHGGPPKLKTLDRVQSPQGRPEIIGELRSEPRARSVHQLSRATCAQVQGPAGTTSSPGHFRPVPEGPQDRPAFLAASGSGPKARGVEQLSQRTCAWV